MRGFLLGGFLIAWSVLWIPLALAVYALRRDQSTILRMARRFWAWGIACVFTSRLEVSGAGRIDPSRQYLFVANHQSHLDVPVLMRAIPLEVRFLAKTQLRSVFLLGRFIRAAGMVFIDRESPRQARASLDVLAARLRSGQSFVAFPEGSRSRDGRLGPFKQGPFRAAIESGVPVVPVAVQGTFEVWPAGRRPARRGLVRADIGEPIPTSSLLPHESSNLAWTAHQRVQDLV